MAGLGVAVAVVFVGRRDVPREAPQDVSFVTRAARADLYGDAINDELVVKPGKALTSGLLVPRRHRGGRRVEGGAVAVGGVGTAAARPERLRPLLRPVPARPASSSSSSRCWR